MRIFAGNAHNALAKSIAEYAGTTLGEVNIREFPDGEIFVKIVANIRGLDVYIVQPICIKPNQYLMEMLIMMDALRRASAARITAVIPYFGYARQDRKDQPRVPITAKLVANLLVAAGADRILTMDLHAQQIQGFFDIPVDHLYAAPVIQRYLKTKALKDMVVVAPDVGGMKMATAYAAEFGSGFAIVSKERRSATEVESTAVVGDVVGRDCILVDDITSTAGTLCQAARLLKAHGAGDIYAAVSHALLSDLGMERLSNSPIKELITTDSVPQEKSRECDRVTILSVAELLGEAILRIHNNKSVSSLFRLED
ncbi:MAG: ribose-phosphate pyrophosphokinase [Spartobacteria bacterium]|nr:ribose-phosphate pyrophosphokinase [Spartobacteria bacterium]